MSRVSLVLVTLGLSLAAPGTAQALSVTCDSPLGECQLSNDGADSAECVCVDGPAGGIAGGDAWAGLTEEELLVECDLFLESWCDPDPPAACSDPTGSCIVDNDPDAYSCECADGSAPSGGGGNAWAGLSNDELQAVCVEQLDACPPVAPPGGVLCQDDTGVCTVDSDWAECQCEDGQDFGGGGPGLYAGYTEAELLEVCEEELASCGAPGAETGISDSDDGDDDGPGDTDGTTGDTTDGTTGDDDDDDGDDDSGTTATPGGASEESGDDDDAADDGGTAGAGTTGEAPDPDPIPDPDPGDTDGTPDADAGQTSKGGGCRIGDPTLPVPAALGLLLFGLGIRRRRG